MHERCRLARGHGQWAPMSAGDVAGFVTRAGAGYKPKTVNEIVVALRSFLRFCYAGSD
jgi:hypothetical protein